MFWLIMVQGLLCVPAHDERDFEFAKKFDIPIVQVISKDGKEDGELKRLIHSREL